MAQPKLGNRVPTTKPAKPAPARAAAVETLAVLEGLPGYAVPAAQVQELLVFIHLSAIGYAGTWEDYVDRIKALSREGVASPLLLYAEFNPDGAITADIVIEALTAHIDLLAADPAADLLDCFDGMVGKAEAEESAGADEDEEEEEEEDGEPAVAGPARPNTATAGRRGPAPTATAPAGPTPRRGATAAPAAPAGPTPRRGGKDAGLKGTEVFYDTSSAGKSGRRVRGKVTKDTGDTIDFTDIAGKPWTGIPKAKVRALAADELAEQWQVLAVPKADGAKIAKWLAATKLIAGTDANDLLYEQSVEFAGGKVHVNIANYTTGPVVDRYFQGPDDATVDHPDGYTDSYFGEHRFEVDGAVYVVSVYAGDS